MMRSRVLIFGDVDQHFSYLLPIDNRNFGKFGTFTGRAIVQDAWMGWAPTSIEGGTVVSLGSPPLSSSPVTRRWT